MERLLGGIAKGLDGLVQSSMKLSKGQDELVKGQKELQEAFIDLNKFIVKSSNRSETRIADLQVAIDEFVQRVEASVEFQKTATGATVDARRALDDSKKALDRAVEESGKFLTMEAETIAPKWTHKALDFIWPQAERHGKDALRWGIKLAAGSSTLAAIAKLIHMALTGHVQ